jgi:serine/threonine protein kinase
MLCDDHPNDPHQDLVWKSSDNGTIKLKTARAGTICGTPEYLPPEAADGDYRFADRFAFGVMLYVLLTFRWPMPRAKAVCPPGAYNGLWFHHSDSDNSKDSKEENDDWNLRKKIFEYTGYQLDDNGKPELSAKIGEAFKTLVADITMQSLAKRLELSVNVLMSRLDTIIAMHDKSMEILKKYPYLRKN